MDDKSFTIRVPKSWVRTGIVALVTAVIVAPLTAIAADVFTDVPNTNTFHDDITWLKDAGVTLGCNPPANTQFCPKDAVTREQMSAFMRRLAENQVVDAATAVQAESADDSNTLEGKAASEFVGKGEADSVTPAMTTSEPGVAQVNSGGFIDLTTTSVTDIDSVSIDAPTTGYVVVSLTTEAWMIHTTGTQSELQIGVSASSTSFGVGEDHDTQTPSGAATGTYVQTLGATKAFPVSAGSNTFYFLAQRVSGGATSQVGDYQLTATFVPSAYGTVDTTGQAADTSDGE